MSEQVIILGITGSIAAYKGADICSKLAAAGHEVHVIMTRSATELLRPKTFLTLSQNPVVVDLWQETEWRPGHIALAERADLLLVAPCTANFMGKLAHGIADDALSSFALAHSGPVLLAPAMNPRMWRHPAVQANRELLAARGVAFAGPAAGAVACGADGPGRMVEPSAVIEAVNSILNR